MSATVSILYGLNPPADTPAPQNLSPCQHLKIPIKVDAAGDHKAYYQELRNAVLQAKGTLGGQLTAWRDAVGKREDTKEANVPKISDQDEELDDEPE